MESSDLLSRIEDLASLSPVICVPMVNGRTLNLPPDRRCQWCCSWDAPLSNAYKGRNIAHGAGLTYVEWLGWHWHVLLHQRGVPLS